MTRAELVRALRERFELVRRDFPEVLEDARQASDERFLRSHATCGACGKFHITVADLVALAAPCKNLDEWLGPAQALSLQRIPKSCRARLDRLEREFSKHRGN
jgi:hypothetical protein